MHFLRVNHISSSFLEKVRKKLSLRILVLGIQKHCDSYSKLAAVELRTLLLLGI